MKSTPGGCLLPRERSLGVFGPWRAWVQGHQGIANPLGGDRGTTSGVLRNGVFLLPKPAGRGGGGSRKGGRLPPRWRQSPSNRAPLRLSFLLLPAGSFLWSQHTQNRMCPRWFPQGGVRWGLERGSAFPVGASPGTFPPAGPQGCVVPRE